MIEYIIACVIILYHSISYCAPAAAPRDVHLFAVDLRHIAIIIQCIVYTSRFVRVILAQGPG